MATIHHLHRQFAAPRDANDLRSLNEAAAQAAAHARIFRIPSARETGEAVPTPAASSVNIWDTFEERERRARVAADELRDARHRRLQAIIHWSCIGIAVGTIIFFAFQLGRGVL